MRLIVFQNARPDSWRTRNVQTMVSSSTACSSSLHISRLPMQVSTASAFVATTDIFSTASLFWQVHAVQWNLYANKLCKFVSRCTKMNPFWSSFTYVVSVNNVHSLYSWDWGKYIFSAWLLRLFFLFVRCRLLYSGAFGGVVTMRPDVFRRINGYPLTYFGWGGEDDDMGYRWVCNSCFWRVYHTIILVNKPALEFLHRWH